MGLALYLPIVLVVAPVAGYFLGHWLDGLLETDPWLTWICIVLGFATAGRQMYHMVRRIQREQGEGGGESDS